MSILTTRGIINWKKNNTLLEEFQNEISKSQQKGKIDTLNTQMHDRSLSCLGTHASINKTA
jgi:hypothetical protein